MTVRCFIEESGLGPCTREASYYRIGFERAFRDARAVCGEHADRFFGRLGWCVVGVADLDRSGRTVVEWEAEVRRVCLAVAEAFPDQAASIFPTMRSAGDHYSFNRWGTYVGVEPDGYIHT